MRVLIVSLFPRGNTVLTFPIVPLIIQLPRNRTIPSTRIFETVILQCANAEMDFPYFFLEYRGPYGF